MVLGSAVDGLKFVTGLKSVIAVCFLAVKGLWLLTSDVYLIDGCLLTDMDIPLTCSEV